MIPITLAAYLTIITFGGPPELFKAIHISRVVVSPDEWPLSATDSLEFSFDGHWLIAADAQSTRWCWEFNNPRGDCVPMTACDRLSRRHHYTVKMIESGQSHIVETISGKEFAEVDLQDGLLQGLAVSGDDRIAAVGIGRSIRLFDLQTHGMLNTIEDVVKNPFCSNGWLGHSFAISYSGSSLAVSYGGQVVVFDCNSSQVLSSIPVSATSGRTLKYLGSSEILVSATPDDRLILFGNVVSGAIVGRVEGHSCDIREIVCSPDGKFVVIRDICNRVSLLEVEIYAGGEQLILKEMPGAKGAPGA